MEAVAITVAGRRQLLEAVAITVAGRQQSLEAVVITEAGRRQSLEAVAMQQTLRTAVRQIRRTACTTDNTGGLRNGKN